MLIHFYSDHLPTFSFSYWEAISYYPRGAERAINGKCRITQELNKSGNFECLCYSNGTVPSFMNNIFAQSPLYIHIVSRSGSRYIQRGSVKASLILASWRHHDHDLNENKLQLINRGNQLKNCGFKYLLVLIAYEDHAYHPRAGSPLDVSPASPSPSLKL